MKTKKLISNENFLKSDPARQGLGYANAALLHCEMGYS